MDALIADRPQTDLLKQFYHQVVSEIGTHIRACEIARSGVRPGPLGLGKTVHIILHPGRFLLEMHGERARELVERDVDGQPTGQLAAGHQRVFGEIIGEAISGASGPPASWAADGQANQGTVSRDLLMASLNKASPNTDIARAWRAALEAQGKTPFDHLVGAADAASHLGEQAAKCCGQEPAIAGALEQFDTIVDICGSEATAAHAGYLVDRLLLADDQEAEASRFDPDGRLLVAINGLSKNKVTPFAPKDVLHAAFAGKLPSQVGALDRLCERLQCVAFLFAGAMDDNSRPFKRILAETILVRNGWLLPYKPCQDHDRHAEDLAEAPHLYPRGMGRRHIVPPKNALVAPWDCNQDETTGIVGADADKSETEGTLQLLKSEHDRYDFDPIRIILLGKSSAGKTTFITGVLRDLVHQAWSFGPGHPCVPAKATQNLARTLGMRWAEGRSVGTTQALLAHYVLSCGPVDIVLTDFRGQALDPGNADSDAQARLADAFRKSDGLLLLPGSETFATAVRDGEHAISPAELNELRTDMGEIADLMHQVHLARGARDGGHIPTAVVINRADLIFPAVDQEQIQSSVALLGRVPRTAFGATNITARVKDFARRTAIGTTSIATQTMVDRVIDMLAPVIGRVAASSHRWEMFFVTGLPRQHGNGTALAAGPDLVVTWILDHLLLSHVSQVLAQIEQDEKALAPFRADLSLACKLATALCTVPAWVSSAARYAPGGRKLLKRQQDQLRGDLAAVLNRAGIALEKEPTHNNIAEAVRTLEERIELTTRAIANARASFTQFRAALHWAAAQTNSH